jgi:hypothetical protein
MRQYLDMIHSDTGTLRLFRHHDLMNGTLYGYHLRRYGHHTDCDQYRTEEGFASEAAARVHGLSQLRELTQRPPR